MANKAKQEKNKGRPMDKTSFLTFLSESTPEEINQYILTKGKPPKLINPLIYIEPDDKKR